MATHVVLVPGSFGFTSLGQIGFRHVEAALGSTRAAAGRPSTVHRLDVSLTASLPRPGARDGAVISPVPHGATFRFEKPNEGG